MFTCLLDDNKKKSGKEYVRFDKAKYKAKERANKTKKQQHPIDIWIEDYTRRRLVTNNILTWREREKEKGKCDDKAKRLNDEEIRKSKCIALVMHNNRRFGKLNKISAQTKRQQTHTQKNRQQKAKRLWRCKTKQKQKKTTSKNETQRTQKKQQHTSEKQNDLQHLEMKY